MQLLLFLDDAAAHTGSCWFKTVYPWPLDHEPETSAHLAFCLGLAWLGLFVLPLLQRLAFLARKQRVPYSEWLSKA